ncbi:MAG: hypothetical protein Q9226_004426 [Calogaya cf. arnoldii]
MAAQASLHAKASAVLPIMTTKPSTIVIAILQADKDASNDLGEGDFLWIKGHAVSPSFSRLRSIIANDSAQKISLKVIYQECQNKRGENKTPWVLKHNGKVVSLDSTVGDINTFNNNVVALEVVDTPQLVQLPPSRTTPLGNPLSPKDPNPRVWHAPLAPKPNSIGDDENSRPTSTTPSTTPAYYTRDSPGPNGTVLHHTHYDRLLPNSSRATPSSASYSSQNPFARPSHTPQLRPAMSPAAQPSWVQVPMGNFPVYRDLSINYYRHLHRGESDDQLERRLWNNWIAMSESEHARYAPQQQPAHVKTEAAPCSQRPALVKAEDASSATPINATPTGNKPKPRHATALNSTQTPTTSVVTTDDYGQKHFQLTAMFKDATPQVLESAVETSVKLLTTLRAPLADKMENSPDAEHWIQQIDNLSKLAVKTKTIIGVVGNTGAGKSSVINAMLEEERLVPTNCMRACTAVVTEISYNYEEQPYCAEIEFITAEEWAKELKVLFNDLLDGEGNVSRECTNEDSDAGVAYAKIKAVYPQKTREDISRSSIDRMLQEVSTIFGARRNIKETDSLMFYKKLQSFVDSKEKSTGKKDKDGKKAKKERELWPLIRVVRLYVKSPALATGAVIVDLPGVHDANAARATVAEGYMKQCTGLWIVAPINRAVDDKAAKSLLGESFKRQLKMDGGFSAVTFICSKTDDISISEAQDSLGLDDRMVPSWEELDRLSAKQKDLKNQLGELNNTKADYEDVANDVDEQIEVWETLETSVLDGKETFPPKAKSTRKRKASPKEKPSKQKRRKIVIDDEDDDDFIDDGSENDDKSTEDEDNDQQSEDDVVDDDSQGKQPLTEEQVKTKLDELKATKKNARTQKREITEEVQDIKKVIKELEASAAKLNCEMSALCISGRNQYSKGAIQQDFAAGIREIDQEIAAEEDEDNFNPEKDVRDYDEVAKSLPVFCVSSRGYQKLQGRLRKDPAVPGFTTIEETEIPALQAHCEKLTETGRANSCRAFINRLSSLLNSLTIWASSDGTGANLTPEQKAKEARYLQQGMEGLETRLEKVTKSCAQALNEELAHGIYDRYETAIQAAMFDAIKTTNHWGSPVDRQDRAAGGLYWSTYKAICRRNGCYSNAQGTHNFNEQLIEPMIKIIAPGWEKVFTRRVASVLNNFTKSIPAILLKFHREIEEPARKIGTGLASLAMLSHQMSVYEQVMKDAAASTKDMIITRQKDINRDFTPVLEGMMQPSYEWCEAERGPGQFKRMKAHMHEHVATHQNTMFKASADEVRNQLKAMVKDAEETLADKTDKVFIQIKRDYRTVLGGEDIPQGEVIPRVQRLVRKEIKKTIEGAERMMNVVLGHEVEDLPDPVEDEDEQDAKSEPEDDVDAHTMRGEKNVSPASASDDIKPEPTDAASSILSPSAAVTSEIDTMLDPTPLGVKEEMEEPEAMDVTDPDVKSDAAEASASEDDSSDGDGASSEGDDLK